MSFAEKMVLCVFGVCLTRNFNLFFNLNQEEIYFVFRRINVVVWLIIQLLIVLWMTRSISDDLPGWGVLFHGLVGDGSISVSISTSFNNTIFLLSKIACKWDSFISTVIHQTHGGKKHQI